MKALENHRPLELADRMLLAWQDAGLGEMVIPIVLEFESPLDETRLVEALQRLFQAHPLLACRVARQSRQPWYEPAVEHARDAFTLTDSEEESRRFLQAPIRLDEEPQLRACLRRGDRRNRLILRVAHTLADAGGVKEIAYDLALIYRRLREDPSFRLPSDVHGSRSFGQALRRVPWTVWLRVFGLWLRSVRRGLIPFATHTLQLPAGSRGPLEYLVVGLSRSRIEKLKAYGRARQATLNDIVVAALYRALQEEHPWDGKTGLRVQTTVDLRRWYLENGRPEAICNLSSFEYPYLARSPGSDFETTLARISALTRRFKRGGIGLASFFLSVFFATRSYDRLRKRMEKLIHNPRLIVNLPPTLTNLGPIAMENLRFDAPPRNAYLLCPPFYPPAVGMGVSGYNGALTLSVGMPSAARPTFESLFRRLVAELPGEESEAEEASIGRSAFSDTLP
ncbi:MAG: hypothetical protein C4523_21125 [Myxococcales bacterium]|nr:MAG: hypothetical protein C4523_21125 [Myxococcales bacterium]